MFRINKIYHIFISHSWNYSNHYETIKKWITDSNITVSDYSIPETKAFDPMSKRALQAELFQQIKNASVVVVIAGGYVAYSEWLQFEIETADSLGKPILAIKPFGNSTWPTALLSCKTDVHYVSWNSNSFISKLKSIL